MSEIRVFKVDPSEIWRRRRTYRHGGFFRFEFIKVDETRWRDGDEMSMRPWDQRHPPDEELSLSVSGRCYSFQVFEAEFITAEGLTNSAPAKLRCEARLRDEFGCKKILPSAYAEWLYGDFFKDPGRLSSRAPCARQPLKLI